MCQQFEMRIGGTFEALLLIVVDDKGVTIEDMYNKFKDTTNNIKQDVVGRKHPKQVNSMTRELQDTCKIKRNAWLDMFRNPSNDIAKEIYHQLNSIIKAALKKGKI